MSQQITIKNLDHLGLIAGIIDDLGIENIVNSLIKTDKREKVSAGTIVKAIILNGLGYLSKPLYLFPEFFRDKPIEQLLGYGIKAEEINDDKIGRVMDELYNISLDTLWTNIGLNTIKMFEISTLYSHLDSSSMSVNGQYNYQVNEGDNLLEITYGYSKDKRQDLKQFMIDLIVSSDGDIPLLMRVGNGNESDKKIFVELIKKYQENFNLETIYVADSALYTALNLAEMKKHNISWLTRVPFKLIHINYQEKIGGYELKYEKNKELIELEKIKCGRFILATNIMDNKELVAEEILCQYKNQQSCERGFRFLKDPLLLTKSVYVKSPKRVEIMGMLMGLCLLVYNIGQRMIRKELKRKGEKIRNQVKKAIDNPTLSWIFQLFQGIHLVELGELKMLSNLTEEIRKILGYFSENCQKYYSY